MKLVYKTNIKSYQTFIMETKTLYHNYMEINTSYHNYMETKTLYQNYVETNTSYHIYNKQARGYEWITQVKWVKNMSTWSILSSTTYMITPHVK